MPTPLRPLLILTALASVGTGVIWNGVAFIAQTQHAYTQRQTLVLYLAMGIVYAIGALNASRAVAMLRRRLRPRQILLACLCVQSGASFSPLLSDSIALLWFVALLTSALSSIFWPLIESYLTAARHGHAMRHAIGLWNIVWTSSVTLSMVLMAPLLERNASASIVLLGVCNALAIVSLRWFSVAPAEHSASASRASAEPVYIRLLVSFRVLLLLSYVVTEALAPLLPFLIARFFGADQPDTFTLLGVQASWRTIIAATWMASRVGAIALMWRVRFWHGSWGTLHVGALCLAIGFAITVASPWLAGTLLGLALLGVGVGIIYYAALYYAMSVGHARVDAGGTHETMIGIGYALGPAAGLIGITLARQTDLFAEAPAIIAIVWLVLLVGGLLAFTLTRRTPMPPPHHDQIEC